MKRTWALSLILALLLGVGLASAIDAQTTSSTPEEEALTQEDLLRTRGSVHGRRGRRNFRTAYWAAGLEGDQLRVYESHGYPSARYRQETLGRVEETWTYIEAGKQYTFRGSDMVKERSFVPNTSTTTTYSVK
jgi:hypothetical protein